MPITKGVKFLNLSTCLHSTNLRRASHAHTKSSNQLLMMHKVFKVQYYTGLFSLLIKSITKMFWFFGFFLRLNGCSINFSGKILFKLRYCTWVFRVRDVITEWNKLKSWGDTIFFAFKKKISQYSTKQKCHRYYIELNHDDLIRVYSQKYLVWNRSNTIIML